MSIEVRDVIAKQDHRFKDTGALDVKVARDCLVMLVRSEREVYYLTLSTHNKNVMDFYQRFPDSNYLLSKKKCEGLKETSLVNLKNIYKGDVNGRLVVIIPSSEYSKLIKRFVRWQESNPDDLYGEVKQLLEV